MVRAQIKTDLLKWAPQKIFSPAATGRLTGEKTLQQVAHSVITKYRGEKFFSTHNVNNTKSNFKVLNPESKKQYPIQSPKSNIRYPGRSETPRARERIPRTERAKEKEPNPEPGKWGLNQKLRLTRPRRKNSLPLWTKRSHTWTDQHPAKMKISYVEHICWIY